MQGVLSPNRVISSSTMRVLVASEIALALALWSSVSTAILPAPAEVFGSLRELFQAGLAEELFTSFSLNLQAIAIATAISLLLAYSTVLPFFRPIVTALSKLRFLSLAGLTYVFTVVARSPHELKLSLLAFLISVFVITSMADVIAAVPKEQFDLARTLRMGEWRVVWEVIVLGQADKVFDVIRQNAAIGWAMLTMVEGIVRSEGGIGTVLMDQTHHFRLSAVFAIQLTILALGLFQDTGIAFTKRMLCPWSEFGVEKH